MPARTRCPFCGLGEGEGLETVTFVCTLLQAVVEVAVEAAAAVVVVVVVAVVGMEKDKVLEGVTRGLEAREMSSALA